MSTLPHSSGPAPRSGATPVHEDLGLAKARVYDPCGFVCSQPVPEAESADYAAHGFTLDGLAVRFRAARSTPRKAGQFVTVWQRSQDGPIRPFCDTDPVDLFVIATRENGHAGQFVFPVDALRREGVVSVGGIGGKRGFRVYPPWVTTGSRQAARAQTWQVAYFLHIPGDRPVDPARARALYHP
ncbi:MepB family protein [Streptomyces sp. NPDC058613]|uniref:MepB family protein n=1 Tax=Streptomyces sp. NPDC058613 TaxID=3346556 RepID=UPI00364F9ABE